MKLNSKKYRSSTWPIIAKTAKIIIFFTILNILTFATASASANDTADFSWIPNSESDLAGYKIRYGTSQNGPYDLVVDVGNPAPVDGRIKGTVSGLDEGVIYYFIAIAYNESGLESDYSAEVSYTCPHTISPSSPLGLRILSVDQ
ncbi:MAG: fibronectin type III domain-containing protein [Pseudomonadota bacterium]|nr:fibronectin type III domain-containing protein [Pseudomonadota bacterium]